MELAVNATGSSLEAAVLAAALVTCLLAHRLMTGLLGKRREGQPSRSRVPPFVGRRHVPFSFRVLSERNGTKVCMICGRPEGVVAHGHH